MASAEIWIAPVIERCLASYSQGSASITKYEDDGSNLRFSTHVQHSALIQGWREQEDVPKLILTDSKSQIEAILTHEALRVYGKTAPDHPLGADLARGYYIQLLDFQVVLEYAMVEPKVHLYVQRFDIDWGRGKIKSAPQGKFVNKNPSVKKLMQHVVHGIRGLEAQHAAYAEPFDDTFGTQAYQDTRISASQDLLMSQLPPMSAFKSPAARTSSVSCSHMTNSLLGNAEMLAGAPNVPETSSDNMHRRKTNAAEQLRSRQNSADITKPSPNSMTVRRSSSATSPTRLEDATGTGKPDTLIRLPSEPVTQRVGQPPYEPSGEFTKDSNGAVTANGSASIAVQGSSNKPSSQSMKPERPCPGDTDPWHGMTKIRRRDIEIPKEQAELLEQHRRRWIPPSPGESTPQGHVPPRLLDQWNKTALRRSRMAREEMSVDVETESHQLLPSQPSPTPQTDSESEGEPLTSQWSISPEQESRSRQILPADSSPVRVRTFRKGGDSKIEASEQPPRGSLESARGDQIIPQPMFKNKEDPIYTGPDGDGQLVGCGASQMKDTTHIQDLQDDSDAESEDSVMDTSVPCPLGDVQQVQVTSQSEQEVISSGSSLPGPRIREHVQVVDTPDNNVSRQSRDFAKKDAGLQTRHDGQLSSDAAKSSSQSRILNTYASSGSKGTSSQDRQDGATANKNSDVLGTQVSNGSLHTDTTPYTTSDLGLNPSASGVQPRSASTKGQMLNSQKSDPFSSFREMPSSIPSEIGAVVAGIDQPTMSRPKRRVSEVEQEQESPAKRPKMASHQEPAEEPALNIVVRRRSYINHSTQKLEEAQRVYEKFRRDYPNYSGGFAHFTELCSKLHAVRSKGHLQRSFLWDDFIIKHLEDYPRYIEECLSAGTKSLAYEDFFSSSYSRPSYKKRSITTHGIEISAAQYVSADQAGAPDTDITSRKANASFTESLVERFTNFHAHSFGPETQGTQSDTDMDYMSCVMSSPTPQTKVRRDNAPDLPILDEEAMETDLEQDSKSDISVHENRQARDGPPVEEQPLESSVPAGETYYDVQDPFVNEDTPSAQLEQYLKSTLDEKETQSQVNTREGTAIAEELAGPGQPESSAVENAINRAEIPSAAHETSQEDNLDSSVPESGDYIMDEQPKPDLDSSIPESEAAMADPAGTEQDDELELQHHSVPHSPQGSTESDIVSESSHYEDDDTDSETKPNAIPLPPGSDADSDSDHSDEEDEDDEMIDETHETASIELGAETQDAAQQQQQLSDLEPESDTESVNENWFVSLRHIRPKGPVWSDDPNTPFKQWARADQAVLSERNRRGGAYLPVDEKGVIQRPGYRR
ncbi:uncharacterized protein BO88DRAFT_406826 [Aspergillus vadensis CBS 113365]|uniref:Telomere replication protein EST3 n=1 Tax=Aspergillus vadensis (strain CBS 113365 / IMI 142717 / IBT 24658) TaxID=1448311 RepID=A0A319B1M9_ASPVC|nr:hypothetical protein BO88DRAFT_406826 [Aspergillus vadensis CBS 113365]PYH66359.1 hypothetical protein BO88DRAFT_406826 [Aspergillus vadensis CBS 113365]